MGARLFLEPFNYILFHFSETSVIIGYKFLTEEILFYFSSV